MTNAQLKIIAIFFMTIDHVGLILFPNQLIFRLLGRLAFPIFAFLIVEGFRHSRNRLNYVIRLFAFAILSEPIFDYIAFGSLFNLQRQNIFFTLAYGFLLMQILESYKSKAITKRSMYVLLTLLILIVIQIKADYGLYGVLSIYLIYKYSHQPKQLINSLTLTNIGYLLLGGPIIQIVSLLAYYLVLKVYNGQLGKQINKLVFYGYYPVHLLVLVVVRNGVLG